MDQYVDFWNLMSYDFSGLFSLLTSDPETAHASNLYFSNNSATTPFAAATAIDFYLHNGVEKSKLILGIPLYGHAFCNTAGLGASFKACSSGSDAQPGIWYYRDLPRPGASIHYDAQIKATWSYDGSELISYDDLNSVLGKLNSATELGGVMFYQAGEDAKGANSLIQMVRTSILRAPTVTKVRLEHQSVGSAIGCLLQ
jgi:chitinase